MGRETYFPHLATLCHNAKVVHDFESNTPFEKLPGTQINVPLSIAPAAPPVPHFPRFRALALFGRRSPQCVDSLSCRHPKTYTTTEVQVGLLTTCFLAS